MLHSLVPSLDSLFFSQPPSRRQKTLLWLALAISGIGTLPAARSQSPSELQSFEDRMASIIESVETSSRMGTIDKSSERFLKAHSRYFAALESDRQEALKQAEEKVAMLTDTLTQVETAEAGGTLAIDVASVDLLMRECLMELQRIEWDLASESSAADETSSELQTEMGRRRLMTKQRALQGLMSKMKIAEQTHIQFLDGFDKGLITERELAQSATPLADLKSQVEQAEMELANSEFELNYQAKLPLQAVAETRKRLTQRREHIQNQVAKLKGERVKARQVERLQSELEYHRKRVESLRDEVDRIDSRASEVRTVWKLLKDFQSKLETEKPVIQTESETKAPEKE
jgi:DNA repair exonuclease SbcCD ATPase subunit